MTPGQRENRLSFARLSNITFRFLANVLVFRYLRAHGLRGIVRRCHEKIADMKVGSGTRSSLKVLVRIVAHG